MATVHDTPKLLQLRKPWQAWPGNSVCGPASEDLLILADLWCARHEHSWIHCALFGGIAQIALPVYLLTNFIIYQLGEADEAVGGDV